jgi:hypothetical protein
MPKCQICGNQYDKAIEIIVNGETFVFDCFECAIHALAPICDHCGVRIIGHGMESKQHYFCSAHCASQEGLEELKDRVPN